MKAARYFATILKSYGVDAVLTAQDGGTKTVRALVQPVRARSARSAERTDADTGLLAREETIFLGPADCGLAEGDGVQAQGRAYRARRVEVLTADEAVYCWALLRPEGEDTPWNA